MDTITIKQVADYAGVSFKTVSRVINNHDDVLTVTRQRVEEAIKILGYRPNLSARSMRTNRSQVIGFITDHIAVTPFAVDVVHGAETTAWEHERMLLVIDTRGLPERLEQSIEMMLNRQVEGIIYAAMYHRKVYVPESLKKVPAILVNCFASDRSIPSVVPDEFTAGKHATEILINKGHTKIALINLPKDSAAAQGRLAGYKSALKKHGIKYQPELILSGLIKTENGEDNRSYEVAAQLLSTKNRPTAIFCGNDRIAMRVYDAVRDNRLSIPDDVAIIGFDNQEVIAENLRPGLSTMALPHKEMGSWAINHLLDRDVINNADKCKLQCDFISRGSV